MNPALRTHKLAAKQAAQDFARRAFGDFIEHVDCVKLFVRCQCRGEVRLDLLRRWSVFRTDNKGDWQLTRLWVRLADHSGVCDTLDRDQCGLKFGRGDLEPFEFN